MRARAPTAAAASVAPRHAAARAAAAFAASRSPFEMTGVLVALFAVALALMYDPRSLAEVLYGLRLPDTDDAMRLVDVRALLAGQPWFDPNQHRFLPPEGVPTHWSRLVDAPIAGLILLLSPLLGTRLAEGATVVAWPMLTFAVYATLVFRAARPMFGPRAAWLALFVACQTAGLATLFGFGRIDHHNVQICCVLGLVLCLAAPQVTLARAALAGALAALSLAVGLETLPYVAAAGVLCALGWVRDGRRGAVPLVGFGTALALAAPALFAIQTAPRLWTVAACDALSPPWLLLAGGGGLAAALAGLDGRHLATPRARAAGLGLLGLGLFGLFALLFRPCLAGPFAHLPPLVSTGWAQEVNEAKSFWAHLRGSAGTALSNVMPVAIAALVAGWEAWRRRGTAQGRLFLFAATMLGVGTAIVQFQLRGIYISSAYVPLVAGFALDRAFALLRDPGATPVRRWSMLGLGLLLVGKVWAAAWTIPPALLERVTKGEIARDPGAAVHACSAPASLAALDALPAGTILAPIDLGPALLLHSHHAVLAAPYHRGVQGLVAGLEAFEGGESEMRRQVGRLSPDYVVVCPAMQADPADRARPFATSLARGEASPDWLVRMTVPGTGVLEVWQPQR